MLTIVVGSKRAMSAEERMLQDACIQADIQLQGLDGWLRTVQLAEAQVTAGIAADNEIMLDLLSKQGA